jgi:hypothetical protein
MTFPRTVTGWLLLGLLAGALAQGCGSSSKLHGPQSGGPGAGSGGKDAGSMTVEPPGVSGADGESKYDSLCGVLTTASCVPDELDNTMCVAASSGKGGSGGRNTGSGGSTAGSGATGTGGTGNAVGTGGTGGSSSPGANGGSGGSELASGAGGEGGVQASAGGAPEGGVENAAGGAPPDLGGQGGVQSAEGGAGQRGLAGAGSPGEAGMSPNPGDTGGRPSGAGGPNAGTSSSGSPKSAVSCQVIENTKHKGTPVAVCGPAGPGTEGSPCFSGEDCAPSLACVGDGPGQCRAYCCSGSEQCKLYPGTHCTDEPLVLATKPSRTLEVPVCMPPVKCNLAEPYPCDSGTCSCPKDSACVVVSDDGTTSCVPRAELPTGEDGTNGDPCPCQPGFVCSQTNTCVELCEVAAESKCSSGRCQASGSLPAGWGTCVGDAPKDAGAP